ncbi:MAG: hypothetical protein BMS9Abin07_0250 [Acidimicrobiia bacterium]|nr:MAG: hypothetical protein BMS9Abin07_0250 [Acidimicrobiia bacterium]
MATQPNPARVAIAILMARRRTRPDPKGTASLDHADFAGVLVDLKEMGIASLPGNRTTLLRYRDRLARVDPDTLTRDEALAYWINLYNAGALALAADAIEENADSVLRVPGAFNDSWVTVGGESLTLTDVEHGKIRRFGDPRIHAALVCGSVSCPTLRHEPYQGEIVEAQLDDQMRSFLAMGGAAVDRDNGILRLSRVLLWYGRDLVAPDRMPTLLPARRRSIGAAVAPWLLPGDASWVLTTKPKVEFAPYDWGLACSIA